MAHTRIPSAGARPRVGMQLAFTTAASLPLADIPARVIYVWPRFRSGDYLVTLEYITPVRLDRQLIQHIDAFMSELYQPGPPRPAAPHMWLSLADRLRRALGAV